MSTLKYCWNNFLMMKNINNVWLLVLWKSTFSMICKFFSKMPQLKILLSHCMSIICILLESMKKPFLTWKIWCKNPANHLTKFYWLNHTLNSMTKLLQPKLCLNFLKTQTNWKDKTFNSIWSIYSPHQSINLSMKLL